MTALAAVASYYVAAILELPESYWAVVSSIIVMQSNVGATVGASWDRMVGTGIGAVVGAIIASVGGAQIWTFGVAIAVTVWICAFLGLPDSYRLAGVTVAIVMLVARDQPFWIIAIRRFLEVSVGIVVSLVVVGLLSSSRARRHLRNGIGEAFVSMGSLYEAILRRCHGERVTEIDALRLKVRGILRDHDSLLKQAVFEPAMGASPALLALWGNHLRRIFLALQSLELSTREARFESTEPSFEPELGELMATISGEFHELAKDVVAGYMAFERPELEEAVLALDERIADIREHGANLLFSVEEALYFYPFLAALRNLARELELARIMRMPEPSQGD